MNKRYWIVIVCLVSITAVMQGCGVGLLATLGAASSGSSGGGGGSSGPSAPPSVFIVSVTDVDPTAIRIDWTASANATSYVVERKVGAGGTWGELVTTGSSVVTLLHTDLIPGTIYYYKVKAVNSLGSTYSNEVNATTTKIQPDALVRKFMETDADYIAEAIYNSDATSQTKKAFTTNNVTTSYYIKVENDGDVSDSFKITATASGGAGWSYKFWAGNIDITSEITGTGWNTTSIAKDLFVVIRLDVTPDAAVPAGSIWTVTTTATSNTASVMKDTVKSVTEVIDPSITTTWGGNMSETIDYYGHGIAIDSNGSTYLAGWSDSSGGSGDVFFIKYASSGALKLSMGCGGSFSDTVTDIAVDATGNIYLCGNEWSYSNGSVQHSFVLKYENSMSMIAWQKTLSETNSSYATGIVLDSQDNVYVSGFYWNGFGSSYDVFLVKYNNVGVWQWEEIWGTSIGQDYAYGMTIDSNNNIYICGNTNSFGGPDVFWIKYDASGNLLLQRRWDGGSMNEQAWDITVDSSGNVYLCGEIWEGTNSNASLLKYNSSGNIAWQKKWDRNSTNDKATGVAVDSGGNIYVSGSTGNMPYDGFLLNYNSSGTLETQRTWAGIFGNSEELKDIKVNSNNIYLVGGVQGGDTGAFLGALGTSSDLAGASYEVLPTPPIYSLTWDGTYFFSLYNIPPMIPANQDILFLRRPLRE